MFKTAAVNSLAAVAAAALVAGMVVFPAAIVPPASAEAAVQELVIPPDAITNGAPCSLQGWPYYERNCQFDLRTPAAETRPVRVIVLR